MEGKGAALIMPACNTEAMNLHLAEIAKIVAPRAHAVLLVDQAGWHMSTHLTVPPNMTIIALPPKSPELNPVENVWQFMRDNWLSNRVFSPSRWPWPWAAQTHTADSRFVGTADLLAACPWRIRKSSQKWSGAGSLVRCLRLPSADHPIIQSAPNQQ